MNSVSDSLAAPASVSDTWRFARKKIPSRWQAIWADLKEGVSSSQIWWLLAWQDIRLRYRRSQLGPFWITFSMAITIFSMGFLYSHLFHMQLQEYFPLLTAGMLTWNLIGTLVIDGANTFVEAEGYLKQIKLPYTAFMLRVICRTFIIFAHNFVVLVPVILFFHVKLNWSLLMELPALVIVGITAFGYGLVLATLVARFRDIAPIVASLMQVAFFVTPVMWSITTLSPRGQFIMQFNPFTHFVILLRSPLLGSMPGLNTLLITIGIMLLGLLLAFILLLRTRHRIVYWL
ncbi:MAG: ABC transporter permease [Gammaproteobacteria bacterium]